MFSLWYLLSHILVLKIFYVDLKYLSLSFGNFFFHSGTKILLVLFCFYYFNSVSIIRKDRSRVCRLLKSFFGISSATPLSLWTRGLTITCWSINMPYITPNILVLLSWRQLGEWPWKYATVWFSLYPVFLVNFISLEFIVWIFFFPALFLSFFFISWVVEEPPIYLFNHMLTIYTN